MPPTIQISEPSSYSRIAIILILAYFIMASPDSWGDRQGSLQSDREAVREAFLAELNDLRGLADYPPLGLSDRLNSAAQSLADRMSQQDALDESLLDPEPTRAELERAGYEAKRLVHGMAQSDGAPTLVLASWATSSPISIQPFLDSRLRELGVGIGELDSIPLYILIGALSIDDHLAPIAAELADLDTVRDELLEQVNSARREIGRAPLALQHQLNWAAQRYAEDMLARNFYGHFSPEKESVMDRVRAAGYRGLRAGENLAIGPETVTQVMQGWMASEQHRKNILGRRYREVGFGVAAGRGDDGYRILWVQCFGNRR